MFKIAFDMRTTHQSGIYRYGTSLLRNMGSLLPGVNIHLFVLHRPGALHLLLEDIKPASDDMEFIEVGDDYGFIRDSAWLRNWLIREGVDLYFSAHYLVDPDLPVPFVYTIHDLIRIKYPAFSYTDRSFIDKFGVEEFGRMKSKLYGLRTSIPDTILGQAKRGVFHDYFLFSNYYLKEKCRHIVTVSNAVKQDLINALDVPDFRVSVIPNAINPATFFPRPGACISSALRMYNLPRNYCIYVGTGHPHKRLDWLIEALARHKASLPAASRLVMVGGHYDLNPNLHNLITAHGLNDFICFTGRVSDQELSCLYSGAKALVVSSIDEGFCLPAVEALSCGTEVVVPDIDVFREVVGSCGHFYAVDNGDALVKTILTALNGALPCKAPLFENRYSWHRSAVTLLGLLSQWSRKKDVLLASGELSEYEVSFPDPTQRVNLPYTGY